MEREHYSPITLLPPAPKPLESQPKEEKMLISAYTRKQTKGLRLFNTLQLVFVSCVMLAQGMLLQRNMIF